MWSVCFYSCPEISLTSYPWNTWKTKKKKRKKKRKSTHAKNQPTNKQKTRFFERCRSLKKQQQKLSDQEAYRNTTVSNWHEYDQFLLIITYVFQFCPFKLVVLWGNIFNKREREKKKKEKKKKKRKNETTTTKKKTDKNKMGVRKVSRIVIFVFEVLLYGRRVSS